MTTIPFTRNAPLSADRLLMALAAARPDELQLADPVSYPELTGEGRYEGRAVWFDWGPGMEDGGALLRDRPDPTTGERLIEWGADADTMALFGGVWRRCWDQGVHLALECQPSSTSRAVWASDVRVTLTHGQERVSVTTQHPGTAALLAYAQLITGLRLGGTS